MYKYEKSYQNIPELLYIDFVSSENQILCSNAADLRLYCSTIEIAVSSYEGPIISTVKLLPVTNKIFQGKYIS